MSMVTHRSSALICLLAICAATQGLSAHPRATPSPPGSPLAAAKAVLQEGDDIPFDRARNAISALGHTRSGDAETIGFLVRRLTSEAPIPADGGDGLRPFEAYRPTPYALARVGLSALPALLGVIASEASSDLRVARAEEAVKQMLQREAAFWYEQTASEAPTDSGAARRLRAAAERLRDEPSRPPASACCFR